MRNLLADTSIPDRLIPRVMGQTSPNDLIRRFGRYRTAYVGKHFEKKSLGAAAQPSPQQVMYLEKRLLPPIPVYASGTRQTIQVDRDGVLLELRMRIAFTVTIPNTTDSVGATAYALASIVRRVEVIVDGQDTIISMTGREIWMRQFLEQGQPFGSNATVVLTKSTATNYNIELRIPLYQPRAQRADDTALDLRQGVSQVVMAVTWGDWSDIVQTATPSTTITNVANQIEAHYIVNCPPTKTFLVRAMDGQIWNPNATMFPFPMLQDRGQDIFYRSFMLLAMNDNSVGGGVPGLVATNALLEGANGNLKVLAGPQVYQNRDPQIVRAEQLGDPWNVPLAQFQTGVYPLWLPMLTSMGASSNATLINTGLLTADLYLQAGVTLPAGTAFNQIWVSREAMRPLRA